MPTRPLAARSYTAAMMRTCSVILALMLVAACGQKGPLYRADEKAPAVTAPGDSSSEVSTPETDEKKKAPVTPPLPDPQSPAETSTPTDPTPAPPAVDPDRPATPPPGN